MEKKHRKLFPLLSETNQTVDCSTGLCDSACLYNCYPNPDYYYTPSPQPASPLLPPLISVVDQENHNGGISSNLIIIITVASVFCFFLLLSFYLAAKFSSHRRNNNNQHQDRSNGGDGEEFLNQNQVDHPIWFIRTMGLQQSVINSITICRYRRDEGLIEGTDCSVCLNEFQEYETLRLLPKCNHAFHIYCIDTWLRSHTNCPLCRAHIVSNAIPHNSALTDVNSDNSSTQMEDSDDNEDTEERNAADHGENRGEPEREGEDGAFKDPVNINDDNSVGMSQNTSIRMESFNCFREYVQNRERNGDQSENRAEPGREMEQRVFNEAVNSNDDSCLNSNPNTNTQEESFDFSGESYQIQERNADQSENGAEQKRDCEERDFKEAVNTNDDNPLDLSPNTNAQMGISDFCVGFDQNQERRSSDRSENSAKAEANTDNTSLQEATSSALNHLDDKKAANNDSVRRSKFNGFLESEGRSTVTGKSHPGILSNGLKLTGSSSISQLLHRGPVSVKRSVSCSGRYNKNMNETLPH